jgi:hypothetical protein
VLGAKILAGIWEGHCHERRKEIRLNALPKINKISFLRGFATLGGLEEELKNHFQSMKIKAVGL